MRVLYSVLTLLACLLLVTISLTFSPHVGLQNDEALFGAGLYYPRGDLQSVKFLGRQVPLMVMSYVGGLKSILYKPVFTLFDTTLLTIRLPVILLAAISVWLIFLILSRLTSPLFGCLGAFLLATDPTFLLCNAFDWGPVAIQITLFLGGFYLILRFVQTRQLFLLGIAFFLWGLALWNKAIFVWSFTALLLAFGIVYHRDVRNLVTRRMLLIAITAFLAGASPLIYYNLHARAETLTENMGIDATKFGPKLKVFYEVLEGSSLYGYFTRTAEEVPNPAAVKSIHSISIASSTGWPRRTLLGLLSFSSLILLFPLVFVLRSSLRKPILFTLLFFLFSLMFMIATPGAGDAAHHFVLFYPSPHAFVVLCLAATIQAVRKVGNSVAVIVVILVVLSNLLVLNTYFANLVANGPNLIWTDAIFSLEKEARAMTGSDFVVMDWGILASLRLLSKGQLPLIMGSDALMADDVPKEEFNALSRLLRNRKAVFISHTPGNEFFAGVSDRLAKFVQRKRMQRVFIRTIHDSHGRPIFELFRFQPPGRMERDPALTAEQNTSPLRGVFYYQPKAAHWWFWENFDREMYLQDLKKIRRGHIDTITLDIQMKDFVEPDNLKPPVRFKQKTVNDFLFVIENAHLQGYKVLLILWYVNGYSDPATSGGARLIHPPAFDAYKEATTKLAELTKGYPVTFFFTNELLDLHAGFDKVKKRWFLLPFPPARPSFISWSRSTFGQLEQFNQQTAKNYSSWESINLNELFAQRIYWNWFSSIIRQRLPDLVAAVKKGNSAAKVGYEDYTYVYGWGDTGIPDPCTLDYVGFGIYSTMVTSSPRMADDAYRKLSGKCPGAQIFVPEVGMDTETSTEKEQAEWYEQILKWARKKEVGTNILMWRDFEVSDQTDSAQAYYGLYRSDGSPKPVVDVLKRVAPLPD